VDIGTGGGFPGVPLALWRSDLSMTWLEPRRKRVEFLTHVQRALGVENAKVLAGRASGLPRSAFDFATARAVPLTGRVFGDLPFLRPEGGVLLWTTEPKGIPPELERAGFRLVEALPVPESVRRAIALYRRI
jgi:16S rRNA (guanine527-N7)-methyltransferase